jgi:ComF family protein
VSIALLARDAWAGALDLVFAPQCVGCKRPIDTADRERVVCRVCWARCRPVPSPRCPRCWGSLPTQAIGRSTPPSIEERPSSDPDMGGVGGAGRFGSMVDGSDFEPMEAILAAEAERRARRFPAVNCRACAEWPPYLRAVRSAFVMGDAVRPLVHALKYRGWSAAADPMAARMAALPWPEDVRDEAPVVVPVPTTRSRLRERGYNQAALLADALARRTGRAFDPQTLERTRETGSQTALHPGERRANVAGAFTVPAGREGAVAGRHVLLVDDVWTTGATALACAAALVGAGARVVSVATFARVFPELDRQSRR